MPRFTCITTMFNEGLAALPSIESMRAQTFEDYEFLIVDDGSSAANVDAVAAVVDGDPRVRLIRQANDGLSSARNRGLELARGDYVCFLDADDTRPSWALQSIADIIDRDDPDLVLARGSLAELRGELHGFYDAPTFDRIKERVGTSPADRRRGDLGEVFALAQICEPQSANKFVRRALIRDRQLWFPNTHFFEDSYFHTLVVSHARRISFQQTPAFGYFRRYGRRQITSTTGDTRFDIIAVTRMTLQAFSRLPQFADPLQRAAVVTTCAWIMRWCEESVSHHYRPDFRRAARLTFGSVDPKFLEFPKQLPSGFERIGSARAYVEGIIDG